jgi:hypothetical protein
MIDHNWSQPPPSDDNAISYLQEILLEAFLLSKHLPGSTQPMMFPDLAFIQRQPAIILSDENLYSTKSIEELSKPIRILSQEAILHEAAHTQRDLVYLRFQSSVRKNNTIQLTLEARITSPDPNKRTLGLGGVQVKFQKRQGQWEIIEDPIFFAT